jgi:crotonobetainyl-CoA:carnitine CoA-transferase CaiB-like acyl-CoA transferase
VQVGAHTPALGEDTDAVLSRVLGWSAAQIERAKAAAAAPKAA